MKEKIKANLEYTIHAVYKMATTLQATNPYFDQPPQADPVLLWSSPNEE
jgi:hypothetical protein